jgi:hypothetical protein
MDRNGYVVYDNDNVEVKRRARARAEATLDTRGAGPLTDLHIANFLAAVRGEEALSAPIHDARTSQLLCHVANIAQEAGETIALEGGRLAGASDRAASLWGREYEPGWELVL